MTRRSGETPLDAAHEIQTKSYDDDRPREDLTAWPEGKLTAQMRRDVREALSCPSYRWRRGRFLDLAPALCARDIAALAAILHRREAETVQGSPYVEHRRPTPFWLQEACLAPGGMSGFRKHEPPIRGSDFVGKIPT